MGNSDEIGCLGAAELARRIADGQFSATQVTEHYIQRLTDLNGSCHVLTCERFQEARREAQAADDRKARGEWLGQLHGVPITVKDCFHVTGLPTTLGVDGRDQLATEDAVLVRRLRQAGAIILAKTNVSQAMVYLESSNPRHGTTLHPLDPRRSPGGSSGGEAATVAAGGTALGIGSDLAGSIRIPAHYCGVYALKPSGHKLTTAGMEQAFPFTLPIPTCPGPLARCVPDLALAMHVMISDEPTGDPNAGTWDLRSRLGQRRLRFAVWPDDGYFPTAPPIREKIVAIADALTERGMFRVELPRPDIRAIIALQIGVLFADGGTCLREFLGQGRHDPLVRETLRLAGLLPPLRHAAIALARLRHDSYLADLLQFARSRSVASYWRLSSRIEQLRGEFMGTWRARQIDFLLTGVFPLPALPHGSARWSGAACGFAFLPNLLDLPAGVVPLGAIPPSAKSTLDRPWSAPGWAQQALEGAAGLPVGLQVLAPRGEDALVMRIMRFMETMLHEPSGNEPLSQPRPSSAPG